MKWGVRRYQNKDGSLTPKGKKRYNDSVGTTASVKSSNQSLKVSNKFIKDLQDGYETDEFGHYESTATLKVGNANAIVSIKSSKGSEHRDTDKAVNFLKKYSDNNVRDHIAKKFYDDDYMRKEWLTDETGNTMSRDEFKSKVKLAEIALDPEYNRYNIYYTDGGTYYGHAFDVKGDIDTGEIRRIDLYG